MSFSSFLFSKKCLLSVFLRVSLYYYTPIIQWMSNLPSISSSFHSYEKLKEAFFFLENGNNPYQISHVFHKPLTTSFFYSIRNSETLILLILIIADLMIAYLIDQEIFSKRNIQDHDKIQKNTSWSALYLINPLTIYNCVTLSTQSLDYLFALASVFLVFTKDRTAGGIVFGLAIYQNPRMILLFPVLFLVSKAIPKNQNEFSSPEKSPILQIFAISGLVFAGLIYLSFLITGSWEFIETCYYRLFFINYYEPNLSLSWHLYTAVFVKYNDFYSITLTLFQIFIIFPLFLLFKKFLLVKNIQIGYLGLFTGFCFMVISLMSPSVTLYELSIVPILLCMQIEILNRIKFIFVFNHALLFSIGISSFMLYSWKTGFTVEPSWIFIQTGVLYGIIVAILSEILTTIKWEIVESKVPVDHKKIQ